MVHFQSYLLVRLEFCYVRYNCELCVNTFVYRVTEPAMTLTSHTKIGRENKGWMQLYERQKYRQTQKLQSKLYMSNKQTGRIQKTVERRK